MFFLSEICKKIGNSKEVLDTKKLSIGDYTIMFEDCYYSEDGCNKIARDMVYPEDLILAEYSGDLGVDHRIVKIIGFEKKYAIVKGKDFTLRIKPEALISKISFPEFHRGDTVVILVGFRKGNTAVIEKFGFHTKRNRVIYILKYQDDTFSNRWYFDEDLELL